MCYGGAYSSCLITNDVQDCDLYFMIAFTPLSKLILKEQIKCYALANYVCLKKSDIFNFHLEFLGHKATHIKMNHRFMEHHLRALIGCSTNDERAKQVGHISKSMHFGAILSKIG